MTSRIYRFRAFELDPSRRNLRLDGQEVPLQPRVFDLLCYLVEHRDRVVSKEELLDTLWPGLVVTESSLQRAISLVRSALQQGGMEGAIRNYARRGYRFLVEESVAAAEPSAADDAILTHAERAYAGAQWQEAIRAFAEADQVNPLDANALERWGIAAQCMGDLASAIGPLERAAVVYSSRGEREAAARVLIGLRSGSDWLGRSPDGITGPRCGTRLFAPCRALVERLANGRATRSPGLDDSAPLPW